MPLYGIVSAKGSYCSFFLKEIFSVLNSFCKIKDVIWYKHQMRGRSNAWLKASPEKGSGL